MEDKLGGIKMEKHQNVQEVSQSLLVNLEAHGVAVLVDHRDYKCYKDNQTCHENAPKRENLSQVL